jgi:hypothetical protein
MLRRWLAALLFVGGHAGPGAGLTATPSLISAEEP